MLIHLVVEGISESLHTKLTKDSLLRRMTNNREQLNSDQDCLMI